jgi:hypothetical protein
VERIAPPKHAAAASTPFKEKDVHAAAAAAAAGDAENFAATLAPLIEQAGRPLSGPGLALCVRAFAENPEGFQRVVEDLHRRRRVRSPLGLLIRMIRDGDHRLPVPPPSTNGNSRDADYDPTMIVDICPSCRIGGGLHVDGCERA